MQALKTNVSDSVANENFIRGNCYYFLTDWVPINTLLIPRRNVSSLSFEIDLNDIRNNIRCKIRNKCTFLKNIRMCHTSKVLIILNQMCSYLYCIYSQPQYSNSFNWNRFEIWNERWQMRTSKTNDSAPQKFIKFIRELCSYFLTK
jgi:hypothetical protein